jgi:leader peptidase (prepilin peptidase)/N-methyltransferase
VTVAVYVLTAALGAAVGSFLNVVFHRVPRRESLLQPGSRCPTCLTPIRPADNIPVLSWLLLRGRCRACGCPISPTYPLVEASTAIVFVAVLALVR